MKRARRRRKARRPSRHISISATDADWEVVRGNANRRGLSIARYLVELVERDGSEEDAGPAVALAAEEQREQLAAVREVRTLMLEGEDASPLVRATCRSGSRRCPPPGRLRWPDRAARKNCVRRLPRCWARSGRASPWARSCRLPRSARRFRRRAKERRTPARTGCCEAGTVSAAGLGEVQEVVHTRGTANSF